jgi:two-component system cell cycle response regulator
MMTDRTPQADRRDADGKRVVVIETRVVALVLGIVGAALGVVALVGDLPVFGALAGLTALGAGLSAMAGGGGGAGRDDLHDLELRLADRERTVDSAREELDRAHRRIAELESEVSAATTTPQDPAPVAPVAAGPQGAGAGALTEPESGLFSEAYFHVALESRLASARRHLRPVAVGLIEVAEGLALDGEPPAAASASRVATALRETVREADIACRLDDGTFAVVLEDTPENGAVWTVERIRRNLVSRFGSHTMWAGIACYPAHAFSAEDLVAQARVALHAAQEWKQDRIEVAIAD